MRSVPPFSTGRHPGRGRSDAHGRLSLAHSYHWLGSFGNRGNGRYRTEWRQALASLTRSRTAHHLPQERALLRIDGQYGTGAVLADLAGFANVTRGKEDRVLDHPLVQARLPLPPDQLQQRPESQVVRRLYDCPDVPVGPAGERCRVVVASHPAGNKKSRVGLTRSGVVYERFFTHLPHQAFTASDVVELYLHRGAFEPIVADEDREQDPDRWGSHSAWGQECWQLIAQWVWNLRLELGHLLTLEPVRTSEFSPALGEPHAGQAPLQGSKPPVVGRAWKAGHSSGADFVLQPDGSVWCPAGNSLFPKARRRQGEGRLRIVSEARIADCRTCAKRRQWKFHGQQAQHPEPS